MGHDLVQVERHIGQRLRQQRLSHGLTEDELAQRIGVSTTQLRLFEKGVKRIPPRRLIEAAETFKVSIGWFFEDAPQFDCQGGLSGISAEMARFLTMPESFALISAFIKIPCRDRRQTVVDYARDAGKAAIKTAI